ncbi:hypothetical protein [Parvularcula maris]|uniref:PEP-CTERM sorting domain-containing protein n=1 Tax=Parvularcula maris TaxID=2965077 RepID=A0A9X2L636_9PROT|nr:hypothetical protein [Parvularcula maris]MCQ8183773.1 hypothetical protein [Parvularcula maris]
MNYFRTVLIAGAMAATATGSALAAPVQYQGITFPGGISSFADRVVSTDTGELAPTNTFNLIADNAIGTPDNFARSLGRGGNIVLQFTDNALTGSGDDAEDLFVFEVGPDIEDTEVEISQDGVNFISVGRVFGSTSRIDIDPFLASAGLDPFTKFFFVRLTDVASEGQQFGQYVGADIDALGAISSVEISPVPVPAAALLFGPLAAGLFWRRKG